MTDTPHIARKTPFPTDLEAGKTYFWWAGGQSKNQPFCDGSHKATSFTPVKFEITAPQKVALCGCKHTRTPPFCDGTHKTL